ncbi:hypothetical protein ACTQV2_01100 [Bifidobacterium thermophilum]|uniref:hypothetical protein n=1 Tax=Bifidobacterium thermophilum TaxID=33905 RepID=UPI003F8F2627
MRSPLDAMEHTFEALDDWNEDNFYVLSYIAGIILLIAFIAIGINIGTPASKHHAPAKTPDSQCKVVDKTGVKECKIKLDDGRTVTCIVDETGRSCDWAHATTRKDK